MKRKIKLAITRNENSNLQFDPKFEGHTFVKSSYRLLSATLVKQCRLDLIWRNILNYGYDLNLPPDWKVNNNLNCEFCGNG